MKLSISTNPSPNTIWSGNSMFDNILKLCINQRTTYSMPAAVNSSPPQEQEHKQPLPQLHLHFHQLFHWAVSYSLTVFCWQGMVGGGWGWSYCSVQGPWAGECEEPSEWGQWCKGDYELLEWYGGITLTGVAVPIVWKMHSSILHFKANRTNKGYKFIAYNKQNSQYKIYCLQLSNHQHRIYFQVLLNSKYGRKELNAILDTKTARYLFNSPNHSSNIEHRILMPKYARNCRCYTNTQQTVLHSCKGSFHNYF